MTREFPMVTLPGGERVPALGQGTWHMGENRRRADEEAAAVRLGIELGMTLIDTAEMYGNGGAEEMVSRAAEGVRDDLFIGPAAVLAHVPGSLAERRHAFAAGQCHHRQVCGHQVLSPNEAGR